jgi:hypothetical protein
MLAALVCVVEIVAVASGRIPLALLSRRPLIGGAGVDRNRELSVHLTALSLVGSLAA